MHKWKQLKDARLGNGDCAARLGNGDCAELGILYHTVKGLSAGIPDMRQLRNK
jgi:hypothetical protein